MVYNIFKSGVLQGNMEINWDKSFFRGGDIKFSTSGRNLDNV